MHTSVLKLVLLLRYMKLCFFMISFHMCLDWFWYFSNLTFQVLILVLCLSENDHTVGQNTHTYIYMCVCVYT
jgi:hypothetical protein